MKFSYKPLWKLMIDRDIKNSDLIKAADISKSTFYKLKNNENVTTDILLKICTVLQCDISEIMECVEEWLFNVIKTEMKKVMDYLDVMECVEDEQWKN